MSEHDFDRTRSTSATSDLDHDATPNRTTRSSQLDAPAHPVASGIVMRKARDANGVAEGADAAVANASTSTGFALPETLMRKFESSLGADLASVRVHTGSDSESAASAVGAKAYTMGHDIHFGAGHYDPSSTTGQHLLAHEVAHTVQQSGGTPTRQNKLEVSSPFDAAEHEADVAADAMVAGTSFTIAGSGYALSRNYDNDLDKAGDAGADAARKAKPDQVLQTSTVKDREAAAKVKALIDKYEPDLQAAVLAKDAKAIDVEENNHARLTLEQYTNALDGEDVGLSNFHVLYKRVQTDYARLDAMAQHAGAGLTDTNNATKGAGKAQTGTDLAKDHIDNATGANNGTSALAARAEKIANTPGNAEIRQMLQALKQDDKPMAAQVGKVVTAERGTTNAVIRLGSASDQVAAVAATAKSQSLKKEFDEATKQIAENKEKIKAAWECVMIAGELLADPEEAAMTAATKALDKLPPLFAGELPGLKLTAQEEKKGVDADVEADQAAARAYTAARGAYLAARNDAKASITAMVNELRTLEEQKRAHKAALMQLGAKLDDAEARAGGKKRKPGELGPFQTITSFLSEADAFIADATAARDVGHQEMNKTVEGSAAQNLESKKYDGVPWIAIRIPSSYKETDASGTSKTRWILATQTIGLSPGGAGSAHDSSLDGRDGANSVTQDACTAIDKFIDEIRAYRDQLRKALDV